MLCDKCSNDKPESEFLFRRDRNTFRKPCKECIYKVNRKWESEHRDARLRHFKTYRDKYREKLRKKRREYCRSERGRNVRRALYKKLMLDKEFRQYKVQKIAEWRRKNRHKKNAHSKLSYAIKMGYVHRQPCIVCGSIERIHAHHEDYTRPLEVFWFCPIHHAEHHRKRNQPASDMPDWIKA